MDARGGPSADATLVQDGDVVGSVGDSRHVGARTRAPDDGLGALLRDRDWVEGPLDWQRRADGEVHARVLTSCDAGACLVLGGEFPGEWSGHLDTATLLARLDDVERHRAGAPLPPWAVTDTLLADVVHGADPARSWWHAWRIDRDADSVLTLTTRMGPMADRHPRITFTPRAARDVTRSPQAVRLQLDGHPARWFWAHRLLPLANVLQGHQDPGTDLCDVTDQVAAAWSLHHVLERRDGWTFTGTCHGAWRRGQPLAPSATLALTRTPGEVAVELCGAAPGAPPTAYRVGADDLPHLLDRVEEHRPGAITPAWPTAAEPWQCALH